MYNVNEGKFWDTFLKSFWSYIILIKKKIAKREIKPEIKVVNNKTDLRTPVKGLIFNFEFVENVRLRDRIVY